MANFKPLNNYSIFILGKIINKYGLKPPFLDVACGTGYLSEYLGSLSWSGKASDLSEQAIATTKLNLKRYKHIIVKREDSLKSKGKYQTILMFDILEHIKNDISALEKAYSLLIPGGHLVVAVPSNPKEWRWDDDFYGHIRRYTEEGLKSKLAQVGFTPVLFYDYTFPFFWALRRIYTKIIKKQKQIFNKAEQTKQSSFSYAWSIPAISSILDKTSFLWLPVYMIQYTLFKNYISKGSAMIILAIRTKK